jgi:hypothetical protein
MMAAPAPAAMQLPTVRHGRYLLHARPHEVAAPGLVSRRGAARKALHAS